jgi:hypothetical protein
VAVEDLERGLGALLHVESVGELLGFGGCRHEALVGGEILLQLGVAGHLVGQAVELAREFVGVGGDA